MALPNILKPLKTDLIRCGVRMMGYLVTKKSIQKAKCLVSFGILDDCSFEMDFLKINKVPTICFIELIIKHIGKKDL